MTADQRLTLILSALGLLFLIMSTGVGILVKLTARWAKIEDNLGRIADKVTDLAEDREREDKRLDIKIERVETRFDRHEEWHRNFHAG